MQNSKGRARAQEHKQNAECRMRLRSREENGTTLENADCRLQIVKRPEEISVCPTDCRMQNADHGLPRRAEGVHRECTIQIATIGHRILLKKIWHLDQNAKCRLWGSALEIAQNGRAECRMLRGRMRIAY